MHKLPLRDVISSKRLEKHRVSLRGFRSRFISHYILLCDAFEQVHGILDSLHQKRMKITRAEIVVSCIDWPDSMHNISKVRAQIMCMLSKFQKVGSDVDSQENIVCLYDL